MSTTEMQSAKEVYPISCPFCTGPTVLSILCEGGWWSVACSCGASVRGFSETEAEAVAARNRRAPAPGESPDFTPADVAAIRAARDFCRSRHMHGHPALDTLADRVAAHLGES